jgi:hypothetical protein
MGNRQGNTRSIQPFLLKYVNELSYEETINVNQIFNTVIAEIDNEGPVVCKMYFDIEKVWATMQEDIANEIDRLQSLFSLHSQPNILPYNSCYLRGRNCILIMRQFITYNLREKMIQKLTVMEK